MATYDLNAIADALAEVFQGLQSSVFTGQQWTITASSEAAGVVSEPAVVIELDDVTYDASMGRGADEFVFLAYLVVSGSDTTSGQRLVRQMLSSGGAVNRLKDALEVDSTLGGLVSYAHMTGTRSIGNIIYNGTEYLGATLEIAVMS